jgi:succinyl-diaminopimelate desuccinylase
MLRQSIFKYGGQIMEDILIALTKRLISISSVSGNEQAITNYIENNVKNLGKITRLNNSLALKISGKDSTKLFILNGHTDTVPAGEGWKSEPYQAKVINGKIIGLGSSDMKSGIAIMLYIAKIFSTKKPPCDLLFMFVESEEVDGSGTAKLMKFIHNDITKYDQSGGLILEPTNANSFGLGSKGNVFCEINFKGLGGHGSVSGNKTDRSIEQLANFINALPVIRKEWTNKYSEALLGEPTINVTSVFAGDKSAQNVIPNIASCVIDVRTTPQLEKSYKKELDKLASKYKFSYSLPHGLTKHGLCQKDSTIFKLAEKYYQKMDIKVFTGATDQCFYTEHNIPMLVYGPGESTQMHNLDEFVKVQNVSKAASVIIDLIDKF